MNTSLYLFTRTILFSAILSLLSCNKSVSTSNNNELEYADSMYAKYMSLKTKTGLNNINVDLISLKYDSTYYKQAQTDIKYLEDYYTNWIQLLNNLDEPELLDSNDSTRTQFRLIISDDQLPHVRLIRVEFLNDQVSVIKKELNNSSISSMPVLKGSTHLDEKF